MWTLMIMNVAEKLHTGFWNQSKKKKKKKRQCASFRGRTKGGEFHADTLAKTTDVIKMKNKIFFVADATCYTQSLK